MRVVSKKESTFVIGKLLSKYLKASFDRFQYKTFKALAK